MRNSILYQALSFYEPRWWLYAGLNTGTLEARVPQVLWYLPQDACTIDAPRVTILLLPLQLSVVPYVETIESSPAGEAMGYRRRYGPIF